MVSPLRGDSKKVCAPHPTEASSWIVAPHRFLPLLFATLCLLAGWLTPAAASAGDAPSDDQLAQAKRLFDEGNALRKVGDCQRALNKYAASRELVPSVANTKNMAVCLADLGRHDEALETYEVLLTEFHDALTADELAAIRSEREPLLEKVGSLDVRANVAGKLVVDGRPRGTLPLRSPVRVLPGQRHVVVMADGYRSAETRATVSPKKATAVELTLEPLTTTPQPVAAPPPPSSPPAAPLPQPVATPGWTTLQVVGVVSGAVGLGAVAAAAITGALVLGERSTIDSECDPVTKTCSAAGMDAIGRQDTLSAVNTAMWGVGIAGVALGVVLFVAGAEDTSVENGMLTLRFD